MALPSQLLRFSLELADIDRGVYDSLDLRVAQHPSEDASRVVLRVLARALLHLPDLEFGKGLSTVEEPALWVHTPHEVSLWVDVGAPSAERLHRASKRCPRVVVVSDREDAVLERAWRGQRVFRADAVEVWQLPGALVADIGEQLGRQNAWVLTIHEGWVTWNVGTQTRMLECKRSRLEEWTDPSRAA